MTAYQGGLTIFIALGLIACLNAFTNYNTGFNTIGYGNTLGTGLNTIGHNTFGTGYNNLGQTAYNSGGQQCPNQTEFELIELFSADPTFYPINNIEAELAGRPDLAACLVREIVLPSAAVVPADNVLLQAKPTCPYLEISLQSFFRYGGRCYILRNYQEHVLYAVCITKNCRKCGDSHGYSLGGSPQQCLKNYQYVSVWAFCTALPALSRISRERIIVPTSCSCRKLRCYANSGHYGK